METFAGIFAWEANLERSRREKSMADQAWPIIPSQATEAIRRSISRSFRSSFSTNSKASSIKVCRGDEIHDLARTWSTIREKNPPLFSSKDEKKEEKSLRRKREREKGNVACRLYCRPVWEILSFDLSAHSMPVSLRQEINDHGPPFQYDLPSEIISRESHGSERAAGSGRTAISSPHEGRI